MRRLLGWILLITVLVAQSAWAFEGQPGHFNADAAGHGESLVEAPLDRKVPGEAPTSGAANHCVHSPVHFLALPLDGTAMASGGRSPNSPFVSTPHAFLYVDRPLQPPRV